MRIEPAANAHRGPTPAMQHALALVAKGVSQRKAAAGAGVSLAGLVKALRRERLQSSLGV